MIGNVKMVEPCGKNSKSLKRACTGDSRGDNREAVRPTLKCMARRWAEHVDEREELQRIKIIGH